MRLPILYTMSWPERVPCADATWPRLDFVKMGDLTFRSPDRAKYPAMDLAFAAGRAGGTMTGVLSAANEQVRVAWPAQSRCRQQTNWLSNHSVAVLHAWSHALVMVYLLT